MHRLTGKTCVVTGAAHAAIAVLLASDEAGYVTGSEFNIDGGLLAGSAAWPG